MPIMPKRNSYYILVALTVIGVVARLIPHVPNVTPVTAIALFISAYVGVKYSIPAILGLMFIGDSIIGFYSWPIMLSVYGSLVVSALLGIYLRKNKTVGSVFVSTMSASLVFFLVTNWAVWQFGTMYAQSWQGLIHCFIMAIPFFKNSLLGDLFYTGLLFGTFEFCSFAIRRFKPQTHLLFK